MSENNLQKWQDILASNTAISLKEYPITKKSGVWSQEFFTDSSQSQTTDSIESTFKALNQNLAQLDFIQNQLNTVDNLYKETLLKQSDLIRLENEDLKKQLQELEIIQSNISNKDRLIQQTNYNIMRQELNIYVLIVSCVLALFLIVAIYMYGIGKITMPIFSGIVSFIILVYIILFVYSYNIFYFKDAMSYLRNRQKVNLQWGHYVKKWGNVVRSDIASRREHIKDEWIENNCECPIGEVAGEEEEGAVASETQEESDGSPVMGKIYPDRPGYFYYDGSSPQQLLVPTPDSKILNQKIDWADYSPNGQMQYIQAINKNINIDDNFYDMNDNKKSTILSKIVGKNSTLVNNTTYTANN